MYNLSIINKLNEMDIYYSSLLHNMESKGVDVFLIFWAHIFNRAWTLIPVMMMIPISYYQSENLYYNQEMPGQKKWSRSFTFFFYFVLAGVFTVLMNSGLKKIIKRERPTRNDVCRITSLRNKENGTFSMPSGDTVFAALWTGFVYLFFFPQITSLLLIIPLVALGRVFN